MKHQQLCGPQSGKLVFQLPGGVTFAYDLCLGRSRDHWKGPLAIAWATAKPKQCRLVPQHGPGSLGPK